LLGQGDEFEDCVQRQLGGKSRPRCGQISGGERDAQGHIVAVDDQDVDGAAFGHPQGAHREVLSEERMCRVGDLDFGDAFFRWVLEGDIKLGFRSTT
jgi:hypothetical protein